MTRTAFAAFLLATPALAAEPAFVRPGNKIGTGQSLPLSSNASNLGAADTRTAIAPRLPSPLLAENASPAAFLHAAGQALAAGRTGEAQEALERAESRALSRSVRPSRAGEASRQPLVTTISAARAALSVGDRARALRFIEQAFQTGEGAED